MRHSVTIENIDSKLLFNQKCDLLDVIGFIESIYENYPDYAFPSIFTRVVNIPNVHVTWPAGSHVCSELRSQLCSQLCHWCQL